MPGTGARILYSVWKNDSFDTVIAIDQTAQFCADVMKLSIGVFYQYASRPNEKWTIIRTGKTKKRKVKRK